jgi:tetratricopeptide (TPR) repeat protein
LDERTLTLTEGYILSRIDGSATVREVLQLVPLDPDETQRTLLGLLLTGRVKARPVLTPRTAEDPARESAMRGRGEGDPTTAVPAAPPPALDPEEPVRAVSVGDGASAPIRSEAVGSPAVEADPASREERPAEATPAALDSETLARRREIVELFQSLPLKNHFEVLGVEPGCADADVRRAYAGLAKRFHPDAHRDPRLADLHDLLEAVFIRVGEAREVLGDATSRASYEARLGVVRRTSPETGRPAGSPAPPPPADEYAYVPPEETLLNAQLLLAQARYWDAIQMLETAIPQMEPSRYRMRGRILLARAYAKNPNWLRKAQEQLQEVVRTDPTNVDAHYELGMLYKAGGLPARAQTMFRRVLELRPDHRESLAELAAGDARGGGLLKKLFGRGQAS